ncbi:MAG: ABC transporter ATP-binding protein [Rhodobacteraceae bacterium]|nr:ABC transporter ATP-binding protein [Paracoccaceae bacterium]
MLRIDKLNVSYGAIKALTDVSLMAATGSVTCILGPNGAGKTTLLQTVAGLLKPSAGSIQFDGENIISLSPSALVKKGIALVPENRLIFPEMTVRENLIVGAYLRLNKMQKSDFKFEIDKIYARFPILEKRSDQLGGTLSGGEQQMLAIGRALMSGPQFLLMDEPSLGLAPKIIDEIFEIIKELKQDGLSVLLVEQNAVKSLKIADYFFLLDHGQVSYQGGADDLENDAHIRKAYLGEKS